MKYSGLLVTLLLTTACQPVSKFGIDQSVKEAALARKDKEVEEEYDDSEDVVEEVEEGEAPPVKAAVKAKPAVALPKEPSVDVTSVGINFEDEPSTQKQSDFNDAVLCFSGKFKMYESKKIESLADQEVIAKTASAGECRHNIEVVIKRADGSVDDPVIYDSRSTNPVKMKFKKGDFLEVSMIPYKKCSAVRRVMTDSLVAKIMTTCNDSGK